MRRGRPPCLPFPRQRETLKPHGSKVTLQIPNRRRAEHLPPRDADRSSCSRAQHRLPKIYARVNPPTPKSSFFHGDELARFLHSFRSGSSPGSTRRMSSFPDVLLPVPSGGRLPSGRPPAPPSLRGVVYVRPGRVCYPAWRTFVSEEDCGSSRACRRRTNAGADDTGRCRYTVWKRGYRGKGEPICTYVETSP